MLKWRKRLYVMLGLIPERLLDFMKKLEASLINEHFFYEIYLWIEA